MTPKPYGIQRLRETFVVAEATRKTMRANRAKDTGPEVALRKALWAAGLRGYRKNVRGLPGVPDVVYGPARLAVFVHGCFWHRCPLCARNVSPKTNAAYWQAKRGQNAERDARNQVALTAMGYRVMVVWECELARDPVGVVARVRAAREAPPEGPSHAAEA
jgi:DNA mismatch endonuclease (patch repair protein)